MGKFFISIIIKIKNPIAFVMKKIGFTVTTLNNIFPAGYTPAGFTVFSSKRSNKSDNPPPSESSSESKFREKNLDNSLVSNKQRKCLLRNNPSATSACNRPMEICFPKLINAEYPFRFHRLNRNVRTLYEKTFFTLLRLCRKYMIF